jgi:hypothetical protein
MQDDTNDDVTGESVTQIYRHFPQENLRKTLVENLTISNHASFVRGKHARAQHILKICLLKAL